MLISTFKNNGIIIENKEINCIIFFLDEDRVSSCGLYPEGHRCRLPTTHT